MKILFEIFSQKLWQNRLLRCCRSEIKAHTAQLQKIGVNINQIAKRINETGRIYTDDMDELKRLMDEVWRLERRLLLQFKGLAK